MTRSHLSVSLFVTIGLCTATISACKDGDKAKTAAAKTDDAKSKAAAKPAKKTKPKASRNPGKVPGAQSNLYNKEALVPPMCYTKTDSKFNPCYVCHQDPINGEGRANRTGDGFLQGEYAFSDYALTNRWSNLHQDRTAAIAQISDDEARAWFETDNYTGLAEKMQAKGFKGYTPDLKDLQLGAEAFDADGFAKDGSNWVAFKYKPMPGAFWPTNGATDDVMIRLPEAFRTNAKGKDSREVYRANLAIAEAALKKMDRVTVRGLDESKVGADLNGDGKMGKITEILRPANYVGGAAKVKVVTWLYPKGTEFLHTVRYLGVDDKGGIYSPKRMKEVRYMVKERFHPKSTLGAFYDDERQDKIEGSPPRYPDLADRGIRNKLGWALSAYIEDDKGDLRPQTYEETLFCMGCHTNIGTTLDQTFAFGRKLDGADGWGYIDLKGMPDAPNVGEKDGEILQYLRRVGGGSEFRANDEVASKYFRDDGTLDENAVRSAKDVYTLLAPTGERAMTLNKAYMVLVREQTFVKGRDPIVTPAKNVFETIDPETMKPLPDDKQYDWDIRLDWSKTAVRAMK